MIMMIAPNFRARKGGKERGEVKGEYGRTTGEEGNADYRGAEGSIASCADYT